MSEPTEQDRKTALDTWLANDHVEAIAQALADEREKARAPFLALATTWEQRAVAYDAAGMDVVARDLRRRATAIRRAAEAAQ